MASEVSGDKNGDKKSAQASDASHKPNKRRRARLVTVEDATSHAVQKRPAESSEVAHQPSRARVA